MTAAPSVPKESQNRMSSAEKQLVIHIGDPKTGTSSIQRALQNDLITSRNGKVSGFISGRSSANAVTVARGFHGRDPERVRAAMKQLAPWIATAQAEFLVLSSEFFIDATPGVLKRAFLRRHPSLAADMQVMAYARPHVGRTLSAYAERVKCGYTLRSFSDWLPHFIADGSLNYSTRFQKWREAFGDGFILRPFLREELRNGDAVADFFSIVTGDPEVAVGNLPHENQTLSLRALAGLRAFNRYMNEAGIQGRQRIPLSRSIARAVTPHPLDSKPELDQDSLTLIARTCAADAQALDAAYFGRPVFAPALEQMTSRAAGKPLDLALDAYFSPAEQAEMMQHASAVLGLLGADWGRWHEYYANTRAQLNLGLPVNAKGGGQIQAHLSDLGRLFSLPV